MKRHASFAAFALAGVLLASACSSSKSPVAANSTASKPSSIASTTGGAAATSSSNDAVGTTASQPTTSSDGGTCDVTASGGETGTFSTPADASTLLVSYWLTDQEKTAMKASDTDMPLAIVCDGGAVLVSITSNGSLNQKNFPKGPSEFTFLADENFVVNASTDSAVIVTVQIKKYATNWALKDNGYLKITALDDNHIAGEFRFSERDSFAKVGSATAAPDTLVTGTFDYKNPKKG